MIMAESNRLGIPQYFTYGNGTGVKEYCTMLNELSCVKSKQSVALGVLIISILGFTKFMSIYSKQCLLDYTTRWGMFSYVCGVMVLCTMVTILPKTDLPNFAIFTKCIVNNDSLTEYNLYEISQSYT